jgi:hypothetical protein
MRYTTPFRTAYRIYDISLKLKSVLRAGYFVTVIKQDA